MITFREGSLLQNVIDYTDGIESCLLYRIWCGIYAMSSHIGRRAWVKYGRLKFYPNFYIVLIGDSGISRKTTALKILQEDFLYDSCPYPFIEGSITKSKLLSMLSKNKEENTINLTISELSVLMTDDKNGVDIISLLTDLFDCGRTTAQYTQDRGVEEAKEPCINLLGASTREWVNTNMPVSFIEGGFSSRCIFVVYLGTITPVAKPDISDYQLLVGDKLKAQFERLKNINGEFQLTRDADIFIEVWYNNLWNSGKKFNPKLKAYFSRKQLHMLKLAMLIAISENTFKITHTHVKEAHDLLYHTEKHMEYAFEGLGDFRGARLYDRIQRVIAEAGGTMLHSHLCDKVSSIGTRKDVVEAIEFLKEAEKIEVTMLNRKKQYRLVKKRRTVSD